MSTHNICLYKKVNKMYTGCNLKTTEFHECAPVGVCAVIRSNTVYADIEGSDQPVQPRSLIMAFAFRLTESLGTIELSLESKC